MPDSSNGRQSSVPEEWSGFFALRSNKTFLITENDILHYFTHVSSKIMLDLNWYFILGYWLSWPRHELSHGNRHFIHSKQGSGFILKFLQKSHCKHGKLYVNMILTFAPIWLPHWPAWICTISRIFLDLLLEFFKLLVLGSSLRLKWPNHSV